MDWEKHADRLFERLTSDLLGGGLGAWLYHFLTSKTHVDGTLVLDEKNKPVMTLDPEKIRSHAPYFVLSLKDEAEFNRLVSYLDPVLQKNLEIQMGPIPRGRFPRGHVRPGLGNHQRADVILTVFQLNKPMPELRPATTDPRDDTKKMLEQLASIVDPMEWKRRAVAFRLMKANESDYFGAQLTEQAQAALVAVIAEVRQGKTEWDNWADGRSRNLRRWQRRLNVRQRAQTRTGFVRWLTSFTRVFQLPTE